VKRLILMRHAKSDWSASGDDHSRPLNKRGTESAPAMGAWLCRKGWRPDEVLCSTSTRTRQTLDLLGLADMPTRFERGLYLAEADQIVDFLYTAEAMTVLLIGHNFGIGNCAHRLVKTPPAHPRFLDYPTCATSLIAFDIDDWTDIRWRIGHCEDFAIPREVIAEQAPD
jgi:phosphohistidine phosphatase